ncbi:hypothetical protein PPL_06630 [Heterostelium album PN500]|uniref:Ankyrin repeat-containing protein n=1 Tax=Heterostelium pallidum (strain ATCC 26659 / Pp 5 / PN500) TaxID=670386 RepID=D3BF97_HETP5|nr:hypothetical protein PPL_06630 [Heterostelium album PN500]EFA79811.1 hypothetical protein PPL_06630 [Heterostelium album PN500]|eukprot:XP_020431932.1 hypothetical protein PPL_06630 [Heterostelium album PN500]
MKYKPSLIWIIYLLTFTKLFDQCTNSIIMQFNNRSLDCNNNDDYESKLFKRLFQSQSIRHKIYSLVKIINRQESAAYRSSKLVNNPTQFVKRRLFFDYYDLGCFPDQLIRYGYHERYKQIFNTLIRDQRPTLLQSYYHRFYLNYLYYFNRRKYGEQMQYVIKQSQQILLESGALTTSSISKVMKRSIVQFKDYNESNFNMEDDCRPLESNSYVMFKQLFLHSMNVAAQMGALDLIEMVYNTFPTELDFRSILEKAVQYGHLSIVEFIHNNVKDASVFYRIFDNTVGTSQLSMIDIAAQHGQLEILKYLHLNLAEGCKSTFAIDLASSNGHIECVKFLYNNRTDRLTNNTIEEAAHGGQLDMVVFLLNNYKKYFKKDMALHMAVGKNHMEIVKFLLSNRSEKITSNCISLAALNGNLELLKLLTSQKPNTIETNENLMDEVARDGNLEIIRFLNENTSAQCSTKAIDNASANGHLDVVQYLNFNRTEGCSHAALHLALLGNHLEVVQFLEEHKQLAIDYSKSLFMINTRNPNFQTFKYTNDGIPKDMVIDKTQVKIDSFIKEKDTTVLDWFKEKGFQFSEDAFDISINSNCLITFKWLHKNTNYPLTVPLTCKAIAAGSHSIVEYLNEIGAPFPQFPMDIAHDLQMLIYLHQNRTESCTIQAMDNAINHGDIQMIKYLKQHNFEIQQNNQPKQYRLQKNSLCIGYNSRLELIKSNHL